MQFVNYEQSRAVPNIVVDGSPNESTVLTLTHWPGIPQPSGLAADLSAEMAYRYLDAPCAHAPADVVTNNHFDQDGLVAAHALVDPAAAQRHRDVLVDVAAAGDFATYRHRAAARASMAIARIGEQLDHGDPDAVGDAYERALRDLVSMVTEPDRFRERWAEEDEALSASEAAIADGRVVITDVADAGLAIVDVPEALEGLGGHRFGGLRFDGLHPMAVNNATDRVRLLMVHGRRYRYVDRYETWVQTRSRPIPLRVDLAPLAAVLTATEHRGATWSAQPPGTLTPGLGHEGESSLDRAQVVALLVDHLRTAPVAWDPFPGEPGADID